MLVNLFQSLIYILCKFFFNILKEMQPQSMSFELCFSWDTLYIPNIHSRLGSRNCNCCRALLSVMSTCLNTSRAFALWFLSTKRAFRRLGWRPGGIVATRKLVFASRRTASNGITSLRTLTKDKVWFLWGEFPSRRFSPLPSWK